MKPWLLFALAFGAGGCEDAFDAEPLAPEIVQARPAEGVPGQRVTLLGERFGSQGDLDQIVLGEWPVTVQVWSDKALQVLVPADATPGTRSFVVRGPDRVSAPFPFTVIAPSGEDM